MARHNALLLDSLVTSIRENNLEDTKHLLGQIPAHVNLPLVGYSYFTPLLFAASLGHAKIVAYLLSELSQEHIESVDNYRRNALMNAVVSDSLETVQLLATKLDPKSQDKHGNTYLHLATSAKVAAFLLTTLRLNPNAANIHQLTPLHAAASEGSTDLLRLLVDAGSGLAARDKDQWTPLHHAAYAGRAESVSALLDMGADPEAQNADGLTPGEVTQDAGVREAVRRSAEAKRAAGSPVLSSSVPEGLASVELSPLQIHREPLCENHVARPLVLEVDSIGATVNPTPAPADTHSSISCLVKKNQSMLSIDLDSLTTYGVEVVTYKELKLKEELGRGGYGRVYRGSFRNNQVAIKVVNDRGPSDKLVRDFLKEIECLVKIRHHRFLLLQGICLEGPLCIVTELAKGGNLSDQIEKGQLSHSEKLIISMQIAEGMAFIHSKNPPIIHRDLKPQNILLDSYKQIKIGDLGLSRAVGCSSANTMKLESTELFAGTIRYMAPEHFDDKPVITRGADVWAFGCILYQLFTNQSPWAGLELPAVQRRLLLKTEFPVEGDISPDIKALISACCNLQATARPKFAEIIVRLEGILGISSSQVG